MQEIEQLHRRMEQLESELESLLSETESLRRRYRRKEMLRRLAVALVVCALVFYCSLAATSAPATEAVTVTAPFKVVDDNKVPIFEVRSSSPRGFLVFDSQGQPVAIGNALDTTAFFKVFAGNNVNVVLGVNGSNPTLQFRVGGPDKDQISLQVLGGTPSLVMYNSGGSDIVHLRQGGRGEGALLINNTSGELRVKAGMGSGNYGVVEALPLGNPLGSFIAGRPKQ